MAGIDKDARKRLDEARKALAGALSRAQNAAATAFKEDDLRRLDEARKAIRAMLAGARPTAEAPRKLAQLFSQFQVPPPPRLEEWPQADLLALLEPEKKETRAARSARLRKRHQELTAAGDPHPTKTVAQKERISVRRVQQLMKDKPRANEVAPTRPPPKTRR